MSSRPDFLESRRKFDVVLFLTDLTEKEYFRL